jgi:DNA polymerase III epsilon subunit-like protein
MVSKQPNITQLTAILQNEDTGEIEQTYSVYIKLKEGVNISVEAFNKTGITREMCNELGVNIETAITAFMKMLINPRVCRVVGHNVEFDMTMIGIERLRNRDLISMELQEYPLDSIPFYCTMKKSVKLDPRFRKKYATLKELYEFLYEEPAPENLHNSLVDVEVCLKCYVALKERGL